MPTPSQVVDTIDILRQPAGAHDGMEDALNVLVGYEKSVCSLLAKCMQAKITVFFTRE